MTGKTEINIDDWNDLARSNNPIGANAILDSAKKGELVVVDHFANRFIPVAVADGDWELRPEVK